MIFANIFLEMAAKTFKKLNYQMFGAILCKIAAKLYPEYKD
jgi:hypothetical protein